MKKLAFSPEETYGKNLEGPVLIVDRKGFFGHAILLALRKKLSEWPIVFLTELSFRHYSSEKYTLFVSWNKVIKKLPNAMYPIYIVVYDGRKETSEIILSLTRKAKNENARFLLLVHVALSYDAFVQHVLQNNKNCCVVWVGDIFGRNMPLNQGGVIDRFLYQANEYGRIVISGNGMKKTYSVYIEDAVGGVLDVAFTTRYETRIFYLFPKHPPTELMLAHVLQKIEPLLRIDFQNEKELQALQNEKLFIGKGEYLLEEAYSLGRKIQESQVLRRVGEKTSQTESTRGKSDFLTENKKKLLSPFILISSCIVIVLLPCLLTVVFGFFGFLFLTQIKEHVASGEFVTASVWAKRSEMFFSLAQETTTGLQLELSLIGQENTGKNILHVMQVGSRLSNLSSDALVALATTAEVMHGKSNHPREDFLQAVSVLKSVSVSFQDIPVDEDAKEMQGQIPFVQAAFGNYAKQFAKLNNTLHYFSDFADVMPSILGFDKKKFYVILFQNNMELRPGGGFIGSYGTVHVQNGRVADFSINDVYDADGKLRGHVEPPLAIRRYLPSVHWFLRDSNFDVDFNRGASASAFLLNKETGGVSDGVISIDVSFVKNLLQKLGPVYIADYNETVTAENLYILTETHVEKNFFPGSTQKKDFLRSLLSVILQRLTTEKKQPYLAFLDAIEQSIAEKHVLFAFSDSAVQNLFTVHNMSSSLWDARENKKGVINDFFGINEANLGSNKANYFITRKINQETRIDDTGLISEKLILIYENTGVSWPGGDYKNYLRIITPIDSIITSINIDGKEQELTDAIQDPQVYEAKKFSPPNKLEVERVEEENKTIHGFLVIIPAKTKKTIVVSYQLLKKAPIIAPEFFYNLRFFKQPGTQEDSFSYTLSYPQSFTLLSSPAGFVRSNGRIHEEMPFVTDMNNELHFSKK